MDVSTTAVVLAGQFIIIVVMTVFVIRRIRQHTWEDIFRAWRRSAEPKNRDDDA